MALTLQWREREGGRQGCISHTHARTPKPQSLWMGTGRNPRNWVQSPAFISDDHVVGSPSSVAFLVQSGIRPRVENNSVNPKGKIKGTFCNTSNRYNPFLGKLTHARGQPNPKWSTPPSPSRVIPQKMSQMSRAGSTSAFCVLQRGDPEVIQRRSLETKACVSEGPTRFRLDFVVLR